MNLQLNLGVKMSDIIFNNLLELKLRVKPALNSKVKEMRLKGINYVNSEDIWEYLRLFKWSNSSNLNLATIVDDILNTDYNKFNRFVLDRLGKKVELPKIKEE